MITEAAGVLFITKDSRALFLKRGLGGDFPLYWCFPGGGAEGDEDALDTAIRETKEEAGRKVAKKDLALLTRSIQPKMTQPRPSDVEAGGDVAASTGVPESDLVDFTTLCCKIDDEFAPTLDDESVGYAWAPVDSPPEPLHPGCRIALDRLTMNELGVARAMADGRLTSPQRVANVTLWDMRLIGTGYAYRKAREEHVWRGPEEWLTEDMVGRCNGMPIVMDHPEKPVLDSKEFHKRIVGIVFLPYIDPDLQEIWGIVKVYDDTANEMLEKYQLSTSPGVLVGTDSKRFKLSSGKTILVEGDPLLADHTAICDLGVWDVTDEPVGVRHDSQSPEPEPPTDIWSTPENAARLDAIVTKSRKMKLDAVHRRAMRAGAA